MRLTAVAILRRRDGDAAATTDPLLLGFGADLSTFGFFQRGAVREMLMFVGRTVAKRTEAGCRQTVQNEDYFCHAHNADGIVGIAFADADYPARAAFGVVASALENFTRQLGNDSWRDAREDSTEGNAACEAAVASYQDPASADKLTAIQRDLDETKVVLHKTIESVLARGEKLDALVDKSADLSLASQMFYKQARKTNSCCKMM